MIFVKINYSNGRTYDSVLLKILRYRGHFMDLDKNHLYVGPYFSVVDVELEILDRVRPEDLEFVSLDEKELKRVS